MDDLPVLISDAYAAALDPSMLAAWTARAGRWLDARTSALSLVDTQDASLAWQHIDHPNPARLEEYVATGTHLLDPQLPLVAALDRPRLYRSAEITDPADPATRAWTAFVNDRAGTDHYATAAMPIGARDGSGGRFMASLTVHNAVADGAVDTDQWRRLSALAPVIGGAMALAAAHGQKLVDGWWDSRLGVATEPAALLDADARLLRATPAFEALLRLDDGLAWDGGRLSARDPGDAAHLDAALARALSPLGQAAATRIARPSGRAPLVLTAWPLRPVVRHLVPDRAALLVTLVDPAATPPTRPDLWRQAFGFTPRESQVAALLLEGHSPESAAAVLEVALGTMRVHVRRLLSRTGTARQSDLLRLLSRIG